MPSKVEIASEESHVKVISAAVVTQCGKGPATTITLSHENTKVWQVKGVDYSKETIPTVKGAVALTHTSEVKKGQYISPWHDALVTA